MGRLTLEVIIVRVVILTIVLKLYLPCVARLSRYGCSSFQIPFALCVFNFCDWLMPSTDSKALQALWVGEYRD